MHNQKPNREFELEKNLPVDDRHESSGLPQGGYYYYVDGERRGHFTALLPGKTVERFAGAIIATLSGYTGVVIDDEGLYLLFEPVKDDGQLYIDVQKILRGEKAITNPEKRLSDPDRLPAKVVLEEVLRFCEDWLQELRESDPEITEREWFQSAESRTSTARHWYEAWQEES